MEFTGLTSLTSTTLIGTTLVSGSVDAANAISIASGNITTVAGISGNTNDVFTFGIDITEDAAWAQKTSVDRGDIFWTTEGTDAYSFEITGTAANSVTVKGVLPATFDPQTLVGNSFELHYGQLIAARVENGVEYKNATNDGTHDVIFPEVGSNKFIDAVNIFRILMLTF